MWRVDDEAAIAAVKRSRRPAELLIADGHHRYETARVYAEEIGGEGPHRYVLMCLVALEDPGLTVFPTHRLVRGLRPEQHETLANAMRRDFDIERLDERRRSSRRRRTRRSGSATSTRISSRPFMLTLKDQAIADAGAAGPRRAVPPARHRGARGADPEGRAGMTDEDIDHLDGLGYARDFDQALELIESRRVRRRFLHGADADRARPGGGGRRREHAPEVDLFLPEGPDRAALQPAWYELD